MATLVERFRCWHRSHLLTARTTTTSRDEQCNESKRSSIDSSSTATTLQPQALILHLPVELIQHIALFLEPVEAAAFSLSSRILYYAIGTGYLNDCISNHTEIEKESSQERRKKLELLERAFSSHWYCAWCEKFHSHDIEDTPSKFDCKTSRACAEYNSYLHDEKSYVLCYHHVRLAMNKYLWGPDFGLALSAFDHSAYSKRTIRTRLQSIDISTKLSCEARIVEGHFILHAMYTFTLPHQLCFPKYLPRSSSKAITDHVTPVIPHIVSGHCSPHSTHTGMTDLLTKCIAMTLPETPVCGCDVCATDFIISSSSQNAKDSRGERTVCVEVWRDLGTGRNPFDPHWRAHGNCREATSVFKVRNNGVVAGTIKRAFEEKSGDAGRRKTLDETLTSLSAINPEVKERGTLMQKGVILEAKCGGVRAGP